jgi:glycosyltransferase involved in cell wall biosynthesis
MSPPSILIDGYNLRLENGTGIATYSRSLSVSLHQLGYGVDILYGTQGSPDDPLLREISFFDPKAAPRFSLLKWGQARELFRSRKGYDAYQVPITGQVISRGLEDRLPYFDRIWNVPHVFEWTHRHYDAFHRSLSVRFPQPPAIAHWTYPLPIRIEGARNIYTVHDVVPLRLPYTTLDAKSRHYGLLKMLGQRADHIVTVSETSKRDIVNLIGIPEDRVTNTYQAVDIPEEHLRKPEEVLRREIEGAFGLSYKEYLLFFSAIEPKKNVRRLLEAYLSSGVTTPLVLVGKKAWKWEEELQLLAGIGNQTEKKGGSRPTVLQVDYIPRRLLLSLISSAKAVLFPSLYEGFGLPVLEAMMLGTPVLTSAEGATAEIAGNAALLVDPYNVYAIAEGIRALDIDANLRGDLSAKGLKQSALFDRATYNRRLDELYGRLTIGGRGKNEPGGAPQGT